MIPKWVWFEICLKHFIVVLVSEDLDQSLLSLERLDDRTSPDLWPERSKLLLSSLVKFVNFMYSVLANSNFVFFSLFFGNFV